MLVLRNRLYYQVKPFLPTQVRLAIRRWLTVRKRGAVTGVWPILPGSERAPQGWRGWPGGKRFALVLTHDIEGQLGLDKCRAVMELEMALGFRSSFNFIPEGSYRVSDQLREDLTRNGFEVGVHDLNHDGKLYRNHREFSRKAQRINTYIREWGAVGFRSGFMMHNLQWLQELNILYEASTFDTDPFEPQPDGAGTIFPFWVPRTNPGECASAPHSALLDRVHTLTHGGYVELPYTLPQDSTLFLVLGERHPSIWMHKLEWLAKHGGMALLNTHPDYMALDGLPTGSHEYPIALYRNILAHLSSRYGAAYWHALPRELAAYYTQTQAASRCSPNGALEPAQAITGLCE